MKTKQGLKYFVLKCYRIGAIPEWIFQEPPIQDIHVSGYYVHVSHANNVITIEELNPVYNLDKLITHQQQH